MNARRLPWLLALSLLAAPTVAQAGLDVTAEAYGSQDATVVARWSTGSSGSFQVHGNVSGSIHDAMARNRFDGDPMLDRVATTRDDSWNVPAGPATLTSLGTRDTTVIVAPLGGPYETSVQHAAAQPVSLRAIDYSVLERNRRDADQDDDVTNAEILFDVDHVVHASSDDAVVRVRGDFVLYVWDADYLHERDDGDTTVRTGHHSEPGSTPSHRDDHFVHAMLYVRDGVLELESPEETSVYGGEIGLLGVGTVSTRGVPAGDTTGGTTDDANGDGRLVATLSDAPGGAQRVALATPAATTAPSTPLSGGASPLYVLAGLLLMVFVLPNLLGHRAWSEGGGPWTRWRATRSLGYQRLAVAAEGQHRFRTAALWMAHAARWSRDPEHLMQRAIYVRIAGRPGRALRLHRRADEMFRLDGAGHPLNAYEAARAAARVQRTQEAFQWLLAAVREEPWLADRAPFEPDLAPLRSLPAFMDLRHATDPDGLLRP